jgi:type IV secretion system protein VirD4
MHYNPFAYIHSEKTFSNYQRDHHHTKEKVKKRVRLLDQSGTSLLLCSIGYIWYEAPEREQNFTTLLK